jgi:hypothetical protein
MMNGGAIEVSCSLELCKYTSIIETPTGRNEREKRKFEPIKNDFPVGCRKISLEELRRRQISPVTHI